LFEFEILIFNEQKQFCRVLGGSRSNVVFVVCVERLRFSLRSVGLRAVFYGSFLKTGVSSLSTFRQETRQTPTQNFPFVETFVSNAPLADDWRSSASRSIRFGWRRIEFTFAFRKSVSLRFRNVGSFVFARL